jgi:hypothetical protein
MFSHSRKYMLKAYFDVSTLISICFHIGQKAKKEAFNPVFKG